MWDRCVEQHFVEDILEGLICVSQTCQSEMMDEGGGGRQILLQGFDKTSVFEPTSKLLFFLVLFKASRSDGKIVEDRMKAGCFSQSFKHDKLCFSTQSNHSPSDVFSPGVVHGKDVFQFNLSSIQDSELILSASFHYLYKRPRQNQRLWRFRRPRHPSGGLQHPYPSSPQLLFHGSSPNSAFATPLGNISLAPFKKGPWQTRDVTAVMKHARDVKELVVTVEFDMGFGAARVQQRSPHGQERLSPANLPYILVYADDRAIDEPNSVAMSLQRYGSFPVAEDASPSASRIRRELHLQIQTNDIPEVQYNTLKNHELWQNTYFPAKAKAAVKPGRKQGQESHEGLSKPQVLSFDERTMKKARRRQWSEPRVCSRRYLRVDFADIGWSEWVLAPKSFDAYYCAGTCGFPIPKVSERIIQTTQNLLMQHWCDCKGYRTESAEDTVACLVTCYEFL